MKRYIIKSKARFTASISIMMIFAMFSIFTLAVSARANQDIPMIPEYVEEGDTLWSMSQKHVGNMDIREYISRVMEINALQSANIKPGELLHFPSFK
ncbi:MAG: LysM peptidoglycan-binding domain-containing protein [Clostridiaceae bacterium]|nr:LysM peptidoglycan-binding domain-containing protein [Clostridiaceae bacterium]